MNFALILFLALVITGTIWLFDHLFLAKARTEEAKLPLLVDYSKSFFPVILIVFFLRSFLVEPFKIPSGSMLPTLQIGDHILVVKFSYGTRIPFTDHVVKALGLREPHQPSTWRAASATASASGWPRRGRPSTATRSREG